MAAPTGTFTTYGAQGNREQLANYISLISQTATPLQSSIDTETVTSRVPRWQTDTLAAATTQNSNPEGNDAVTDASTPTVELANPVQIFDKVPRVSRSQIVADSAGRGNEMAYQVEKRALEMKRDIESTYLGNQGGSLTSTDPDVGLIAQQADGGADDTTNGRTLAGLPTWMQTIEATRNSSGVSAGTVVGIADGGVAAGVSAAGTPITVAADVGYPTSALDLTPTALDDLQPLNENSFITLMQRVYDEGGAPDCVLLSTLLKTRFSDFRGFNRREIPAEKKEIVQTFDVYHTDFGPVEVIPDVFFNTWVTDNAPTDDLAANSYLFCLEKEKLAAGVFDDFLLSDLAKTGDSERKQLTYEGTLICRNRLAHGMLVGINAVSTAVTKV